MCVNVIKLTSIIADRAMAYVPLPFERNMYVFQYVRVYSNCLNTIILIIIHILMFACRKKWIRYDKKGSIPKRNMEKNYRES